MFSWLTNLLYWPKNRKFQGKIRIADPYEGERYGFGARERRPLHTYVYDLDPDMLMGRIEPLLDQYKGDLYLAILNWVIGFKYTSDLQYHGVRECWPLDARELLTAVESRQFDCEEHGVLIASAAWSLGLTDVHLAAGWHGAEPRRKINHVYAIRENFKHPPDPFVMEATGIIPVLKLPLTSKCRRHHTLLSYNRATTEYWLHGALNA